MRQKNCSGYLVKADESSLGYYGRLYSSGDLVRIHAHEHTGLLAREDREQVENDFKRGKRSSGVLGIPMCFPVRQLWSSVLILVICPLLFFAACRQERRSSCSVSVVPAVRTAILW